MSWEMFGIWPVRYRAFRNRSAVHGILRGMWCMCVVMHPSLFQATLNSIGYFIPDPKDLEEVQHGLEQVRRDTRVGRVRVAGWPVYSTLLA